MDRLERPELAGALSNPGWREVMRRRVGGGALVVDLRGDAPLPPDAPAALEGLPIVIVGVSPRPGAAELAIADVMVASDEDAKSIVTAIERRPIASTSLALLLRGGSTRTIAGGIISESATYSTLQAGPEFQAWCAARPPRRVRPEPDTPVRVERGDRVLRITLQRPHVHNAFSAATRDALIDALLVAEAEPALDVELAGDGPTFCSGGDLDEFGTFADPATAHLLRVSRSAALAIAPLADRTTVHVHGTCAGAGVELAAFAGRVIAHPGTTFALPETGMGLVPGAGGTVSLPRRIGRHRTGWLALTGEHIDAATARHWGLVDEVGG